MTKKQNMNHQNMTLGTKGRPKPISKSNNQNENKNTRSAHCGFPVKFHSLTKTLVKYLLKLGIIYWRGRPLTLSDSSLLVDLYICGKITTKQFLRYFFQTDAPIKNFRYSKNDDGSNNEYLQKKLLNIIDYFKQNKQQLQQQRKLIRKIFYYLRSIISFAQWFYVFRNKYYSRQPYLKYLNKKFSTLHGVEFTYYIKGKNSLDVVKLCQPIIEIIKKNQRQQLRKIDEERMRKFDETRRKLSLKKLHFEYQCIGWNEFQIRQSDACQKLTKQGKILLMDNFRTYTAQIISLHRNPSQRLQRRYVPTPFSEERQESQSSTVEMEMKESEEISQSEQLLESNERSYEENNEEIMIESLGIVEQSNQDIIQTRNPHLHLQTGNIIESGQNHNPFYIQEELWVKKQSIWQIVENFVINYSPSSTNNQIHQKVNESLQTYCHMVMNQIQLKQLDFPIMWYKKDQDNDYQLVEPLRRYLEFEKSANID